ncbi:hypothetical protein BTVI_09343 [Pitangus sulphuratus]|nr:hypothetical protein BTVI_09343 [Pitangus sulphuratus]
MSKDLYKLWIKYRMFAVVENKVKRRRISPFFMFGILHSVLSQMIFQYGSGVAGPYIMGNHGAVEAALTATLWLQHDPIHSTEYHVKCVYEGQVSRTKKELLTVFKENDENMVKQEGWSSIGREQMESPLEVFENHVDIVLREMV